MHVLQCPRRGLWVPGAGVAGGNLMSMLGIKLWSVAGTGVLKGKAISLAVCLHLKTASDHFIKSETYLNRSRRSC